MTLSLWLVRLDRETKRIVETEPIEGSGGIVGTEDSRRRLWSNPAVIALNATHLSTLREGSLLIDPVDVRVVRDECERILANLSDVARAGSLPEDHVELRVRNVAQALDLAEARGMGLLIE